MQPGVTPKTTATSSVSSCPRSRRKEEGICKKGGQRGEQSRIAIRNIRPRAIEQIKKLQRTASAKTKQKMPKKEIQEITDKHITLVEKTWPQRRKRSCPYSGVPIPVKHPIPPSTSCRKGRIDPHMPLRGDWVIRGQRCHLPNVLFTFAHNLFFITKNNYHGNAKRIQRLCHARYASILPFAV